MGFIEEHKEKVVIAGLLVGALYILNWLPKTTTMLSLYDNVYYIYLGIIGYSAFIFWNQYHKIHTPANFQRNVDPRNLSNPDYVRNLNRQYPNQPQRPMPQQGQYPQEQKIISDDVWATFNKK